MNFSDLEKLLTQSHKANKLQILSMQKIATDILCSSFENHSQKINLKKTSSLIGVSLVSIVHKLTNNYHEGEFARNVNNIILPQQNSITILKTKLNRALPKIKSMNYQKLFYTITTNKNYGIEQTLDSILKDN